MTEAEWLASDDPAAMLEMLLDVHPRSGQPHAMRPSDRKLRLFACACCRSVCHLLTDPRSRRAVEVAERFADGDATEEERLRAERGVADADPAGYGCATKWLAQFGLTQPFWLAQACCGLTSASEAAWEVLRVHTLQQSVYPDQAMARRVQAALLREIIGNPYRRRGVFSAGQGGRAGGRGGDGGAAISWTESWQKDSTVIALAQAAYKDRLPDGTLDPARLAVLSDALEEVGCMDEAILGHLRSPAPHVRGCWALDLILGKK